MFQTDPYAFIVGLVAMSLLPFLAMIATSYLKIVVVISLIRNALGIQSIPPNMVVNALALILTFYIMAPMVEKGWGIFREEMHPNPASAPALEGQAPASPTEVTYTTDAALKAAEPFKEFLIKNAEERQIAFFSRTAESLWATTDEETGEVKSAEVDEHSYFILVPAFCVSELTRAFEIGFLVYLPFIAIDIIISNILLAMGMMMVSPVTISLPFKLLLFVMVDGWTLLIQGLVQSYMR